MKKYSKNSLKRIALNIFPKIVSITVMGIFYFEFKYRLWVFVILLLSLQIISYLDYYYFNQRFKNQKFFALLKVYKDNSFKEWLIFPIIVVLFISFMFVGLVFNIDFPIVPKSFPLLLLVFSLLSFIRNMIIGGENDYFYLTKEGVIDGATYFEKIYWNQIEGFDIDVESAIINFNLKKGGFYRINIDEKYIKNNWIDIKEKIEINSAQHKL